MNRLPGLDLATGFAQNPATRGAIRPVSSASGMKSPGATKPSIWVHPAHERLDSAQGTSVESTSNALLRVVTEHAMYGGTDVLSAAAFVDQRDDVGRAL